MIPNAIENLQREIDLIKTRLGASTAFDDLISKDELMKKLGISDSTLRRHELAGRLSPIVIGHSKLYKLSELIRDNAKSPAEKITTK